MASEDIATGHNAKLEDDDFVIDPNKMKRKGQSTDTAPAAPSYSVFSPPPARTPPPAMTPPPSFAPSPVFTPPAPPTMMAPPPAPEPVVVQIAAPVPQPAYDPNAAVNFMNSQQNFQQSQATAQVQAQASVGLAQTSLDKEIIDRQLEKEDEHWVKSFWRPAMGWLYMLICFMDFVGFPLLTIFLPIIFKPFGLVMPYTAWQSLTLSNGGLIHLAFGAILGVSAFTRGQEKIANK
jgi:hypothetical protein